MNSIKTYQNASLDDSVLLRALERYVIPHPPRTVTHKHFSRWGRKLRYWAIACYDGYCFGDFMDGIKESVFPQKKYTQEERQQRDAEIQRIFAEADKERKEKHQKAKGVANQIWDTSVPVIGDKHAYLIRKKVQSFGLRTISVSQLKETGAYIRGDNYEKFLKGEDSLLVIPLQDTEDTIHSVQFINAKDGSDEQGNKMLLGGGKKNGHYFPIGEPTETDGYILLCEGCSTGATLYEATGHNVICCIDAGNLLHVAQAIRTKYPEAKMIMCADYDGHKDDHNKINVGLEKAKEAGNAVGAYVFHPVFSDVSDNPSDFNDLYCSEGIDAVKNQVDECLQVMAEGGSRANVFQPAVEYEEGEDGSENESENPKKAKKIVLWYHSGDKLLGQLKSGESIFITDKYIKIKALIRQTTGNETKETVEVSLKNRNEELRYVRIPFDVIGDKRKTMEFLGKVGFSHESKAIEAMIYEYLRNSPTKELPLIALENKSGFQKNMDYVCHSFSVGSEIQYELCGKKVGGKPNASLAESTELLQTLPDNPVVKFGLFCALAGFFVRFSGVSTNPIFNFYGETTIGKSTLTKLSSSVCGHPLNMAKEWKSTTNAMEGVAERGNDGTVFLDENKQLKDADTSDAVYTLANGRGKERLTRSGINAEVKTFRGFFFSCGESRLQDKVVNSGGGFKVRAIDIDADPEGKGRIFYAAPKNFANSADYVKYLEEAIEKIHTVAGYTCVKWFLEQFKEVNEKDPKEDAMRQMVKKKIEICRKVLFEEFKLHMADKEVQRMADNDFALVMAGALLGVESGVFPWSEDDAIRDVYNVFGNWLEDRGGLVIPRDSTLEKLKEWLTSNDNRFVHLNQVQRADGSEYDYQPDIKAKQSFNYSFGYKVSGEEKAVAGYGLVPQFTEHYVLPKVFAEFCKKEEVGLYEAKRELVKAGVLTLDEDGQPIKISARITHDGARPRAYCVKFIINSDEQEETV